MQGGILPLICLHHTDIGKLHIISLPSELGDLFVSRLCLLLFVA